jgi:hypothetical protein
MSDVEKLTAADIELALARYFNSRRNFVIPNISWGFRQLNYEVDVMVVTPSRYAYDVEIKVSVGDLKRDASKHKWLYCRDQHYFRRSYFAVPESMLNVIDLIPDHAGVLAVSYNHRQSWYETREVRAAAVDNRARKVTEAELAQLGRLAMLRMWDLKHNLRILSRKALTKDGEE